MDKRALYETVLEPCPTCGSEYTSVRFASHGWYYVGCECCENKRLCDESKVHDVIKQWNSYGKRVKEWKNDRQISVEDSADKAHS